MSNHLENSPLVKLFGNHPKPKILTILLSSGQELTITNIHEESGLARSTIYLHLFDLVEMDIVNQTRKVAGSPLYRINKNSEVTKIMKKIEWKFLKNYEP